MQPGDILGGRFEIREHVASGGMGSVFRARDVTSGEIVAVKVLLGELRGLGARFDREGQALAMLQHPGIVRYVAHGMAASGQPYLVMEWLDGEDLATRLTDGKLTLEQSLALARRVAEAVYAAHARDIVHRDLKPSNIFLVNGRLDRVKVLDFGIARLASGTRLTGTGMMLGTPGYMAPEQATPDGQIDARADVFSLGCVLFECLTGVYAFAAEHPMALLAKVMFAEPQRLRDVLSGAPPALDALLSRMMAKDPEKRPPHGGAVAEEIAALGERGEAGFVAQPAVALTRDEQRMFSIVLVGEDGPESASPMTLQETLPMRLDPTLRDGAAAWGGRLERLQGGAMVVAIDGRGVVTDQAAQAARCALWLRTRMPGSPIALATGRGDRAGKMPAAETIDRAVAMLLPGLAGARAAEAGIEIDEVTARLLDARFDVRERGGAYTLHGEQELIDGTRMLLGRPTPCVGRELELRALELVFEECVEEPAPRAALVTAPPGAGKSRLAQELLRAIKARPEPVSVWICRGEPQRAGSAFGMLSQLLRGACGIQGGEPPEVQREKLAAWVAARIAAGERARVAAFLGELAGVAFPDDDSLSLRAARQDAQLMHEQMRAAFLELVEAETASRPVLLVLEDLQWGDAPTVQFLDVALRELRERPLCVLALARPEVYELFPKLWAERSLHEVSLKQLGRKSSEQLVRHVLGENLERGLVDRLVRLAEGNAFYLEELIRAAAEGKQRDLPETVVAMVQSRLDALAGEARRILRAASVFGEVFWPGAVARLLGEGAGAAGIGPRLEELVNQELILRRKQSQFADETEYAFRHALLREGAYIMLTAEDRVLGHRLAGEWLEQHGEQDPLVLAEHFERGGDGARAGLHYLRAAEHASQGGDSAAAFARAQRALASNIPDELRTSCLGMLCELLYFRMNLQSDAIPYAQEVLRVAQPGTGPWSQGMLLTIVYSLQVGMLDEFERLLDVVAESRPAPGAATPWSICIGTGIYLLDLLGRPRGAEHLLDVLAEAARARGEGEPAALALWHCMRTLRLASAADDPRQGLEDGEAFRRISDTMGHRRYVGLATSFIGMNRWYLGAFDGTDRMIEEVSVQDDDTGLVSALRPFVLAWLAADRGALADAQRWAGRLVADSQARRVLLDEGRGQWVLAEVQRRAGQLDAADAAIEAALAILRLASPVDTPGALATLAAIRLAQGRTADALTAAAEGVEKDEAMGACGFFRGGFLRLTHAECLEAAGDREAAKVTIAAARARLFAIAAKISEPEYRRSFLEVVPENRRTLELARQLVGPDEPS